MPIVTLMSGRQFEADASESLLDAGLRAGVAMAYSCRTGRCSTCKAQVRDGLTAVLLAETGLDAHEREQGWILSCARSAQSDLTLDAQDLGNLVLPTPRTIPCRIQALDRLSDDVVRVRLRLPPTVAFDYLAGQYIDVIGPGGVRRSYSLANAPAEDRLLELHIRRVDGGEMSAYWFERARVEDLLRLHGPQGTFVLRDVAGRDVVFLATGTGYAPVKALLEALARLPQVEQPSRVRAYWGGRRKTDLYLPLPDLPGVQGVPVLSRADDAWAGARGHVQDVFLAETPDCSGCIVYACGSDAMIHGAREQLVAAGLPSQAFHADAFVCSAHA